MTNFDGICVHDFPWPRRVLPKYSVTGDNDMTIQNCKTICQGKNNNLSVKQTFRVFSFKLKISYILDSKMEIVVIVGLICQDLFLLHFHNAINRVLEMYLSFVEVVGA